MSDNPFWVNRIVDTGAADPQELAKGYNPDNWRFHPQIQRDALEEALDSIGVLQPVLFNRLSGKVIDGHLRIELAILKGQPLIPVNYVELTDDEEALALATLDAITEQAQPIPDKLAALMERTREMTAERPGLRAMLEQLKERAGINGNGHDGNGQEPPMPTETEAEKLAKQYGVKVGQVWALGRHVVACIDSTDEESIRELVGDIAADMVFADPPYGIDIVAANGYVGGGEAYDIPFGGVKANKGYVGGGARIKASPGLYPIQTWKKDKGLGSPNGAKPFGSAKVRGSDRAANLVDVGKYAPVIGDETTETAINAVTSALVLWPDACHIWWGGNYYANVLPPSPGWIVWDKDNTGNFADCELAWTNQKRVARIFEHRWNGMLKASEQGQRRVHPTQKPIALAEEVFREYGQPNDLIFDPFLGSGISVLAAERLNDGRWVIGCELAPEYIGVTIFRWQQLSGQSPRLISG